MHRCNCPHEVRPGCMEPRCSHYVGASHPAVQARKAEELLNEAAGYLAATLAKPDERAWRNLLTYLPPEVLRGYLNKMIE